MKSHIVLKVMLGFWILLQGPISLYAQKKEFPILIEHKKWQVYGERFDGYNYTAYIDYQFGGKPVRVYSSPNKAYNCFACGLTNAEGKLIRKGAKGFINHVEVQWLDSPFLPDEGVGLFFYYEYYTNSSLDFIEVKVYDKKGKPIGNIKTQNANEKINMISLSFDYEHVFYTSFDVTEGGPCSSPPIKYYTIVNIKTSKYWQIPIPADKEIAFVNPSISWGHNKLLLTFSRSDQPDGRAFLVDMQMKKVTSFTYDSKSFYLKMSGNAVLRQNLETNKIEEIKKFDEK